MGLWIWGLVKVSVLKWIPPPARPGHAVMLHCREALQGRHVNPRVLALCGTIMRNRAESSIYLESSVYLNWAEGLGLRV